MRHTAAAAAGAGMPSGTEPPGASGLADATAAATTPARRRQRAGSDSPGTTSESRTWSRREASGATTRASHKIYSSISYTYMLSATIIPLAYGYYLFKTFG